MSDDPRLLVDDGGRTARSAADAATYPRYDDLVARGLRRRRGRRTAALALAVAVTLGGIGAAREVSQSVRRGEPVAPAGPKPTPTQDPSADPTTAAPWTDPSDDDIVDAPDARLEQVVVDHDDTDVRASVWGVCRGKGQYGACFTAVAFTTDGYRTRRAFSQDTLSVLSLDVVQGQVAMTWDDATVVVLSPEGDLRRLRVDRRESPLQAGDALLEVGLHPVAVDLAAGRAHRVGAPGDGYVGPLRRSGNRLELVTGGRLFVSADGGSTWSTTPLPAARHMVTEFAPSAARAPTTIVAGGDAAALLPFESVLRQAADGSFDTTSVDPEPMPYLGRTGVLPDGRLVVDVDAWNDDPPTRRGRPWAAAHPRQLYELVGSRLEPVVMGPPFDQVDFTRQDFDLVSSQAVRDDLVLVASRNEDGTGPAYSSTDGGRTWTPYAVR